jgi:AraC-like DNA-binding protein
MRICLSRDTAARLASMSPAHFSRRFHKAMGVSFFLWNLTTRINEAKRLLLTTALPIWRIASEVGCPSVRMLERNFRRYVGVCPREFRQRATHRASDNENSARSDASQWSVRAGIQPATTVRRSSPQYNHRDRGREV